MSFMKDHAESSSNSTTTSTSQSNLASQPNPQQAPSRPRIPNSKHFSTSVISQPNASKDPAASSTPSSTTSAQVHPLRNTWVFWFRQQRAPGNKIISYEEGIKKIAAFSSVESFWSLWTHLAPPSALQPTTDYLLFHTGIRRPVWEDPLNISGGKWIIRLKKGIADRFWEDLVMAIIGDQFDNCRSKVEVKPGNAGPNKSEDGSENSTEWPEICGCTISVRQSEDIVTVWNRVDGDPKLREQIRDTLRKVLNLPPSTVMEYKSNNDSMQDKSSFRRTAIEKTPLSPVS